MGEAIAWRERIEARPDVLVGKPVIRGTRVSVEVILDTLSVTDSISEVMASFPRITEDDVRAALLYAMAALRCGDSKVVVQSSCDAAC